MICSVFAVGCGSEPKKAEPLKAPAKEMTEAEKLHQKAKVAEAASLIGYDGKDIRKKLDTIIDENEKHQQMLKDVGNY